MNPRSPLLFAAVQRGAMPRAFWWFILCKRPYCATWLPSARHAPGRRCAVSCAMLVTQRSIHL